ncbi:hypothetical protein LNAOJCKE_3856 [Methylorubrum aminovorans]|uniref:Phage holin family protein n=1 Tax=Methylorubrum aminovorans TaxID=269069 RepID=A0ABQ4UIX4_9HYPH|nr:hypothetical protein [Methylorubrum aminovorans]GJE66636.1 hypothetical protein LNAOJCKE_3856 [Methylorubrum aminovorans]
MQAETVEDRARARHRMERELRRLEGLAGRKRVRRRILRALRGTAGAAATFGALVKLKLVGTLAGKAAIALAVGLGLAWPTLVIGIIGLVGIVLALLSLFSGEGGPHSFDCDWPCECGRKEARARRLKHLIAQRRSWLAAPSGAAPSVRWDARGRYATATAGRANARKRSR